MNATTTPVSTGGRPAIIRTCEPLACCDTVWEDAYLRFETPEEERKKFIARLKRLGVDTFPRDSQIVEIFCGRGNGLNALRSMGFTTMEGVDLSERLLEQYDGAVTLYVADCRKLPFPDASRDVVIVQGGMHHLPNVPDDVATVVSEVRRILRPGGRFVIVEPWMTPYLRLAILATRIKPLCAVWGKLDAYATMTEREAETYFAWLAKPQAILDILDSAFVTERRRFAFGQLEYVGHPA